MKIAYKDKRFSIEIRNLIEKANEIIEEYSEQGFELTLRQLYYQFVARDLIENTQKSYKRLGMAINDGRLAGLVSWEAIVDRTRNVRRLSHWDSPAEIVEGAASQFRMDMWENQKYRPEVWIEKDALVGVIEDVCDKYDVPYFSCRGYTSQSEMWSASQRLLDHNKRGQSAVIIHLGDHDPSGIDMTRDIRDRLELFMFDGWADEALDVDRIALTMDQVEEYNPPPNPAKITDTRAKNYIHEFGDESWELDALEPAMMVQLIEETIQKLIIKSRWKAREKLVREHRKTLDEIVKNLKK
jgi:hypothetical protein